MRLARQHGPQGVRGRGEEERRSGGEGKQEARGTDGDLTAGSAVPHLAASIAGCTHEWCIQNEAVESIRPAPPRLRLDECKERRAGGRTEGSDRFARKDTSINGRGIAKLHIAKASRRVILVNRAPCTNNLTKLGKRIMQVLVCPASREALDKDVAVLLA